MEAMAGSAGRRVPRVVEAPQEALQLQRQDAMRDAEKMATQAGWEASACFFSFFLKKLRGMVGGTERKGSFIGNL